MLPYKTFNNENTVPIMFSACGLSIHVKGIF